MNIRKLQDVIRDHITEVYLHTHGNVSESARLLGIGRSTMFRYIRDYNLDGKDKLKRSINKTGGILKSSDPVVSSSSDKINFNDKFDKDTQSE